MVSHLTYFNDMEVHVMGLSCVLTVFLIGQDIHSQSAGFYHKMLAKELPYMF